MNDSEKIRHSYSKRNVTCSGCDKFLWDFYIPGSQIKNWTGHALSANMEIHPETHMFLSQVYSGERILGINAASLILSGSYWYFQQKWLMWVSGLIPKTLVRWKQRLLTIRKSSIPLKEWVFFLKKCCANLVAGKECSWTWAWASSVTNLCIIRQIFTTNHLLSLVMIAWL